MALPRSEKKGLRVPVTCFPGCATLRLAGCTELAASIIIRLAINATCVLLVVVIYFRSHIKFKFVLVCAACQLFGDAFTPQAKRAYEQP